MIKPIKPLSTIAFRNASSQPNTDQVNHRGYKPKDVEQNALAGPEAQLALPSKINILGVNVSILTFADFLQQIAFSIRSQQKRMFLHVNVHGLNVCRHNKWLPDFLNQAPIVFSDGFGVILGARLLGHDIPERMTGADWIWDLADFAQQNEFSIFCLGTKEEIIEKAAAALQDAYPTLKLVGTHHGYFDKRPDSAECQQVIEHINRVQPDILLIGFGWPLQEQWLRDNWAQVDAKVAITGGAMFDYVAGDLTRAPLWLRKINMEWLGRLLIEPRRLATRYLVGNPLFLWRIGCEMIRQRIRGRD